MTPIYSTRLLTVLSADAHIYVFYCSSWNRFGLVFSRTSYQYVEKTKKLIKVKSFPTNEKINATLKVRYQPKASGVNRRAELYVTFQHPHLYT